ncbi:DNA-processing protein DprA [Litoribacter alkaliphilus]|uniref:DNA-processing protein DprA n=1 Tax=Litoribacter ruber TaxID=702568 RepID=A0AAP2G3L6_9BACT|nr:DNA-processing protein DprA [Litoribacter alkaliphilus]MBS9523146.1 DNA-processing protein DprA [Litoribacter alkaliphilus]
MNTKNDEHLYSLALSLIPKIGPSVYKNIISYSGSAQNFFNLAPGKAAKIPRIGSKLLELLRQKNQYLAQAEKLILQAEKLNVKILTYASTEFPKRLKSIEDSPSVLFVKGNIDLNANRLLGIVGTRNATDYGKTVTRKIIEEVAPFQPVIVSGLAYGIDIEAHRAALQHDLPTVAVMGSPIDKIYPYQHKNTAEQMLETGGLISEFRPGSDMVPGNFPQRNRIIAGLSDALIVVEAAKKGGALITAEIAFSYNKEIFAVPGNLQSPYSEGCNQLIKTMKANIYLGTKDLEEALSWSKGSEDQENQPVAFSLENISDEHRPIIAAFLENPEQQIDQLSWITNIPISMLASSLLQLEFMGLIRSLPGKTYKLVK